LLVLISIIVIGIVTKVQIVVRSKDPSYFTNHFRQTCVSVRFFLVYHQNKALKLHNLEINFFSSFKIVLKFRKIVSLSHEWSLS